MRRILLTTLAVAAIAGPAASRDLKIKVTNPSRAPRAAVPVVVDLARYAPGVDVISASATVKGSPLTVQLDDLDIDGRADEAALTVDVPARGSVTVNLTLNDTPAPDDSIADRPLADAYLKMRDEKKKHPRLVEIVYPGTADNREMYNSVYPHGAVLENQYVALRVYMDNRQSIDLYGKNKPGLEADVTAFYTTPEQLAQGYGRDILWAGKSVGAGSFRGWQGAPVTIDTVATRGQRVIAAGPVRAIVDVTDRGWMFNGTRHDMTQRYTVWGPRRDLRVDVRVNGIGQADAFCTGIQKLESDNTGFIDGRLAGSWGSNVPEKKHPELVEWVGLGQWTPADYAASSLEDDVNYLTILRPDADGVMTYYVNFAAGREEGGFDSAESWRAYLSTWADELENPCKIEIK